MPPKAFIFDVFGTLVDWRNSVTREVRALFDTKDIDADAHAFAVAWRDEYEPSMKPIRSGARGYTNLDVLHLENLESVVRLFGLTDRVTKVELSELVTAWQRLDPWADSVSGLEAVRLLGLVAPCSNGSIAMMSHLARHAGFHWDCILGAEVARNYKPHPDTYLASCNALQLRPDEVMMVAAHNDDLHAAQAVGLQTGYFPRPLEHANPEKADLTPTGNWNVVAQNLKDLAGQIGGN